MHACTARLGLGALMRPGKGRSLGQSVRLPGTLRPILYLGGAGEGIGGGEARVDGRQRLQLVDVLHVTAGGHAVGMSQEVVTLLCLAKEMPAGRCTSSHGRSHPASLLHEGADPTLIIGLCDGRSAAGHVIADDNADVAALSHAWVVTPVTRCDTRVTCSMGVPLATS